MKLSKLTVCGFGPFRELQAIDLGACNEAGLFMVAGPTGSGKTSLLDAIAFALYGETTGAGQGSGEADGRRATDVRCTACAPTEETFVELEFALLGEQYRVRRNPEYVRAARRGSGTTTEAASVSIHQHINARWEPVDGVRKILEANALLERKLGLTSEQFRRVVVIPQGRFREVLLSAPQDRQELLKRIFGTHLFERFTELVKERASDGRGKLSELDERKKFILDGLDWAADLAPDAARKEAEDLKKAADEARDVAERELEKRTVIHQRANDDLRTASERNKKIAARKTTEEQLGLSRGRLDKLEPERRQLEESLRAKPAVSAIREERIAAARLEEDRVALKVAETDAGPCMGAAKSAKDEYDAAVKEREVLLPDLNSEAGAISERIKTLKDALREVEDSERDLANLRGQLAQALQKRDEKNEEERLASDSLDSAQKALRSARDANQASRAGLIAKELQQGCPCPVCGSPHHPLPAQLTEASVDDSQLKECEEAVESATNRHAEAREAKSSSQHSLESVQVKIDEMESAKRDLSVPNADALRAGIRCKVARLSEIEQEQQTLNDGVLDKKTRFEEAEKSRGKAEKTIERARSSFTASELVLQRASDKRESEMKRINESDQEAVLQRERSDEWMAKTGESLDDANKSCNKLENHLNHLRHEIGDGDCIDTTPLEQTVKRESAATTDARKMKEDAAIKAHNLERVVNDIRKLVNDIEDAELKFRPAHELAQVVLGATGESRVSLHAWVLGAFLDEVLAVASCRLRDMTRGRYELRRMTGQLDGRQEAGLNVEVFDSHTGTSRPARTLSGGETFLASLAMALALAEVAGARGGRALDTVFIDEGFGTLDAETLDTAMNVLNRLRESGRTVGLISHVDEMKRRVPIGIEVVKDQALGTSRVML